MYLFALVALASTATLEAAGMLPRNVRAGHPTALKQSLTRQAKYYEEQEPTPYENSPFRKHNQPVIILKNVKYPKFPDIQKFSIPKLTQLMKNRKHKRLRSQSQYDSLFDENGMLFLTDKKDTEDRKLNTFLNKLVKYKMDEQNHKYIRKPLSSVFKKEELDVLKTIVDALNSKDGPSTTPKIVFDFDNLVI